jgi:GT2 family glycosyltransferase
MDLSVSIVSFNTRELLARTLRATLADTREMAAEVIVVDNASHDGSAAMVREAFPSVRLIRNSENRFFSAAHNQAIAVSRGRHVLVLNSDAEPRPGTLPPVVAYLDAHADVAAVSPRMLFPDGRVQRNCARFTPYTLFLLDYTLWGLIQPGRRRRGRAEVWYDGWDRLTERQVDVLPGSFMMMRREAIDAVGPLDERLRLYFVEEDWCWRARHAGFRIVYVPVGAVVHPEGASVRQVRRLARRIYFEDMVRHVRKRFGSRRARWLWLLTRPTRWGLDLAEAFRAR